MNEIELKDVVILVGKGDLIDGAEVVDAMRRGAEFVDGVE